MEENQTPLPTASILLQGIEFTHHDIHRVVNIFYNRIQHDPILKVPFSSVHDWPEHVKKLTHFWWVRLGGKPYLFYPYNPVEKHFFAGFNSELLARWLMIFHDTLKKNLKEDQFNLWALISTKMGQGLSMKNEIFKKEYEGR